MMTSKVKEIKPTYKVRACIDWLAARLGRSLFTDFFYVIPSTANDSYLTFKLNEMLLEKKKIAAKITFFN